jgi:hypothetical protein
MSCSKEKLNPNNEFIGKWKLNSVNIGSGYHYPENSVCRLEIASDFGIEFQVCSILPDTTCVLENITQSGARVSFSGREDSYSCWFYVEGDTLFLEHFANYDGGGSLLIFNERYIKE